MKKIAVPLMSGVFSSHFGGAEAFAIYQVDEASGTVGPRRVLAPPEHGRGVFPTWLHRLGADVVMAGGMGPRAVAFLSQNGIEVVLGIEGEDPDALVHDFLAGTLVATGQSCSEHGFHDCGHHEHRQDEGGCSGHHPRG